MDNSAYKAVFKRSWLKVYNQNTYVTVVFESVEKKIAKGECMSEKMWEN